MPIVYVYLRDHRGQLMTTIFINALGILLIGFVIGWFFVLRVKPKKIIANTVKILVKNGVYLPAVIEVNHGQTIILRFLREDSSPCSQYVIFNQLNKSVELPLHEEKTVQLHIEKPGEYEFTCQMGMYRGKIIVV